MAVVGRDASAYHDDYDARSLRQVGDARRAGRRRALPRRRRQRRRRRRCCEDADSFSYIRLGPSLSANNSKRTQATASRRQSQTPARRSSLPPSVEREKGAETGPGQRLSATQQQHQEQVGLTDSLAPPRTFSINLNQTEVKPQRCARRTARETTKSSQKQHDPRPDNFT